MLPLVATTDKFQLVTSAAVTVDVVASFVDTTQADPPVTKGSTSGKQSTRISTAATTDVVNAPAASTTRNVKKLMIRNRHATSQVDVTFQLNENATITEIYKVTLVAGSTLEYVEGVGFFVITPPAVGMLQKVLTADDAGGQNVLTAQPWFPTAGGVTVAVGTYYVEGLLQLSRAAGTNSHTTGLLFAGTAVVSSIMYTVKVQAGDVDTNLTLGRVTSRVTTNTLVKAASTSATEQAAFDLEGIVRFSAAGTFIPQFIYSAAPGGAPTILRNTYIRMTPLGDANFVQSGVWA